MANVDRPRGFTPLNRDGSEYSANVRTYHADGTHTAIFVGDAVQMEADGNINAATATSDILGVVTGVHVDLDVAATEHPGYLPANTEGDVYVAVARPDVYFLIQEDGALAETSKGSTAKLFAGSGSTTTGRSAFEVDSSETGSGTVGNLLLIDIDDSPDNEQGTNADWIVTINRPQLGMVPNAGV
jgi:hypothetical protein